MKYDVIEPEWSDHLYVILEHCAERWEERGTGEEHLFKEMFRHAVPARRKYGNPDPEEVYRYRRGWIFVINEDERSIITCFHLTTENDRERWEIQNE